LDGTARENPTMNVLIAEDSATARVALQRTLADLGHTCIVAEDGDAAWELFVRFRPEVVISDWMMPGIDGDELCRRVRHDPGSRYTYFILLTALDAHAHLLRGMEAGADDYLKKPFDADDLHARLIAAARVTVLYERLNAQQAELEALNGRLFDESRHDPLTAIGNRIALHEHLARLTGTGAGGAHDYCVALYDVDKFKVFNDTQGHLAGDQVLEAVAGALASGCRAGDAVYRYGGEEFLVVLPKQTLETASIAAERLRTDIALLGIAHPALGTDQVVTVSAGISRLDESDRGDFELVLKRADLALYRAKELGRNRVCTMSAVTSGSEAVARALVGSA
jgi:diguanylate cyclase (GGDEF)-like protein